MADGHHITHYLVTDLAAITRGRGVWDAKGAPLKSGVGWVPVNQIISPFDTIASPNPWGSHGDCRLRTDASTLVELSLAEGPDLRFALCDMAGLDGTDLGLCARSFLRRMIAELEAEGLYILSSFEQEFWLDMPGSGEPTPGFSYQRAIRNEPFGAQIMTLLEQAGVAPEMLLAEFAADQFELTMEPSYGMVSADRAVISREVVRAAVHHAGGSASFCPLRAAGGVGSGVHVHLSLWDRDGQPLLHDPEGTGGLSILGQAFCAGIVRHMPALCALTASSVVSYERLQPHRWSSAYTCMGDRNREATLRICPVVTGGSTPVERQFNVEYRAADATANPYLVLGALIAAGLDGIRSGMTAPPLVNCDPSELPEAELARRGIERLPQSLGEALDRLVADELLCAALGAPLVEAFMIAKRHEIDACAGLDADALCRRYAAIY